MELAGQHQYSIQTLYELIFTGTNRGLPSYLRLAMRLLLRPIPRHFSRCGAKREAAMLRLQLGHTHSLFFHWLYTWPNTSNPGWSTISGDLKQHDSAL